MMHGPIHIKSRVISYIIYIHFTINKASAFVTFLVLNIQASLVARKSRERYNALQESF